ncbi:hypothetical protein Vafri_1949, partial [Volvox africanus]
GECLAGELGCCGDSCCSSAVVSRALAEYCQHSDAAREAFVAAQGVDALQVALARGSPSVATAAARVIGALCASPHGLRCVLRWQRDRGSGGGRGDLLSTLAAAASQAELPPDLRAECVDALRCALGSLHGPAAGGGLELAGMLQAAGGLLCGSITAGDFLTKVALPPLLSSNTHLRAAAARLIAAAVEEGLLPADTAGDAAAASLLQALGLASDDGAARASCEPTRLDQISEPGDETRLRNPSTATGARRALALCELVAALLGSSQGAEVLVAMRAPFHVLERCREALTGFVGCSGINHEGWRLQDSSDGVVVREALLDAVLLCAREGPQKLWTAANEVRWRERRAFVAGAAMLAALLLSNVPARADASAIATVPSAITARADGGFGEPFQGETAVSTGATSTVATLASALASWPREVLGHADLRRPFTDLLSSLSSAAVTLLHGCCPGSYSGSPNNSIVQPQLNWIPAAPIEEVWGFGTQGHSRDVRLGLVNNDHFFGDGSKTLDKKTATLRVITSSAAAMVRLYGAVNGSKSNSSVHASEGGLHNDDEAVHSGDDVDALMKACTTGLLCGYRPAMVTKAEAVGSAAVAKCLGHLLEAAYDSTVAAATLIGPSMEALLELDAGPFEALRSPESTPSPPAHGAAEVAEILLSLNDDLNLATITDCQDTAKAVRGMPSGYGECFAQPGYRFVHKNVLARGASIALENELPILTFGQRQDASSRAVAGSCGRSSAGSRAALLLALVNTLRVAVSWDACNVCLPMQAPESWDQLRARVHKLNEFVPAQSIYGRNALFAEARQLQEAEDIFDHNNAGESPNQHPAATLDDPNTILDECLACIGAGIPIS